MDFTKLKRINVIGTSGSGKSTLAKELSQLLNIPYVEMDSLFWKANWTESTDEEFIPKIEQNLSSEKWVLDGNYQRTAKVKWKNVQTIIWVDYSKSRTFFQAVKRAIVRILNNKELWPGTNNRENFKQTFLSKKSILLWTYQTYDNNVKKYEAMLSDPAFKHIQIIRLRSPKEKKNLLKLIEQYKRQ